MINPPLATRLDPRWPDGLIGRRDTRILKNARLYLATPDGQIAKFGWGDLDLERWHLLREISNDGLGLVARQATHGRPPGRNDPDPSETADATFDDLIDALALALDHDTAVLLNHHTPGRQTLGAISLPALTPEETHSWLADRLDTLTRSAER